MASLPPLATSSSLAKLTVTKEQFNMFHNIDRLLFTRLVRSLRRDPYQSMQVMGLWMWLEQSGQCRDLVDNMLRWPDTLLSSLVDEAVLCLNCVESDQFPLSFENNINIEVPFTQSMTKSRVSLRFFRENRFRVLLGVARNVNEVCVRAFEDILQVHAMENNRSRSENLGGGGEILMRQQQQHQHQQLGGLGPVISPVLPPVMHHHNVGVVGDHLGHQQMANMPQYYDHHQGLDVYDVAAQRNVLNGDQIGDMLSGLQIFSDDHDHHEQQQVRDDQVPPPDERTIFLTFSKGYPISESEIRDFFSRSYGECIEAIYMQEVAPEEQPLYARLVVNSCSTIEVILSGKSKAKFSINSKHVWARKFVRKNNKSPSRSSSPITITWP